MDAKSLAILLLGCFCVGCGDTLTNQTYAGEPRMVLEGSIHSLDLLTGEEDVYVGIQWFNLFQVTSRGQVARVTTSEFPAGFQLALYDAPPVQSLNNMYRPAAGEVYAIDCEQSVRSDPGTYEIVSSLRCQRESSDAWSCFVGHLVDEDLCRFAVNHHTGKRTGDCGSLDRYVPWGTFGAPATWTRNGIEWSHCESEDGGTEQCEYTRELPGASCRANFSGGASRGFFGTGFISVFADGDGDGQFNVDYFSPDPWLASAPYHMLVFGKDLDAGGRRGVAQTGVIANPERLSSGFHLARVPCFSNDWGQLQIIDPEVVPVLGFDAAEQAPCPPIF